MVEVGRLQSLPGIQFRVRERGVCVCGVGMKRAHDEKGEDRTGKGQSRPNITATFGFGF